MMSIWLWIILSWIISIFLLRREKVNIEHYIWVLLPVDMYGISIAGAMIKPYMIFCVYLIMRMIRNRKLEIQIQGRWALPSGGLTILMLVVNLLNNDTLAAPKASLMVILVWLCSLIYLNSSDKNTWAQVPHAIIAAGIGYGIVFIMGYIFMRAGIELPGIVTNDRSQAGFFLSFSNWYHGDFSQLYRLRGFTIDPNTMIGTFAFCSVVSIYRIVHGKGRLTEGLGIIISGICVLLSNSRMGLICFLILIIITILAAYRSASNKMRNCVKIGILVILFAGVIIAITTNLIQDAVMNVLALYANRSGLTDEYGRLTIWKEAISILLESNPAFGIGMGQMQYYTTAQRACHNTWLEMVCGSGMLVGGALVLNFVMLLSNGLFKMIKQSNTDNNEMKCCMVVGVLIVMISLISVDNITYSYLWFAAATLSLLINEPEKVCAYR